MHRPKYSLLVPVRNEAGRIGNVVEAIFADLGSRPDWEVCIADDYSDDGSYERLSELARTFPFRLFRPEKNLGRGPIRNLLAQEAHGATLVFLDGDCRPLPGFFSAWEGPEIPTDPDPVYLGNMRYEPDASPGFARFLESGSGVGKLRNKGGIPYAYFVSGNFRISKNRFEKAGGFRSDLPGWGGEDLDFGLTLRDLGAPLRYREKAQARHAAITDLKGYFARLVHFGRANLPLLTAKRPELLRQFKLPMAEFPFSLLFLNPVLFGLCKFLVIRFPGLPWPFSFYRYVIFNCYARGWRERAFGGATNRA